MRILAAVLTAATLSACASTAPIVSKVQVAKPPTGATVVIVKPDITLAALTASGVGEPRADWIASATQNLTAEAEELVRTRGLSPTVMAPEDAGGGRAEQILKLHGAVSRSILIHSYGGYKLPTKPEFDWTLGDGVQQLAGGADAGYALFIFGEGTYSTSGRVAMTILMAAAGVGLPSGGQQVFASLVDVKTGRVVWSNVTVAGPNDMRTPEGADSLARMLFKDAPL
jgi:hypothetical protein